MKKKLTFITNYLQEGDSSRVQNILPMEQLKMLLMETLVVINQKKSISLHDRILRLISTMKNSKLISKLRCFLLLFIKWHLSNSGFFILLEVYHITQKVKLHFIPEKKLRIKRSTPYRLSIIQITLLLQLMYVKGSSIKTEFLNKL